MKIENKGIIVAAVVFALLLTTACNSRSYSQDLYEDGEVIGSTFMPANHGSATGVSSKGSLVVSSVEIPAVYAVVFKCEHGQFVVQGEGERYKQLWEQLPQGTKVDIVYREIYEGSDDKKRLVKLDFLYAKRKVNR